MEIFVSKFNHCDLVEISGRIDSYSAPQIDSAVKDLLINDHYNIIIDLQKVKFISSSGILTFVNIQRKLKQEKKGEIVFINVPELIYQSFSIAGFDTVFKFFSNLETAMDWF